MCRWVHWSEEKAPEIRHPLPLLPFSCRLGVYRLACVSYIYTLHRLLYIDTLYSMYSVYSTHDIYIIYRYTPFSVFGYLRWLLACKEKSYSPSGYPLKTCSHDTSSTLQGVSDKLCPLPFISAFCRIFPHFSVSLSEYVKLKIPTRSTFGPLLSVNRGTPSDWVQNVFL